jgi:diguanylate cyclase (GGDEF)-like protein
LNADFNALQRFSARFRRAAFVDMPPDIEDLLYLGQGSDLAYMMLGISMLGLNTVALLMIDYRHNPGSLLRWLIAGCMIVNYAVIVWRSRLWLGSASKTGLAATRFVGDMRVLHMVLGFLWSLFLIVLMHWANEDQHALIFGILVGCMATPIVVTPISCALAYWVPLSAGAFASVFFWTRIDPFSLVCLSSFIFLTLFCIVYLNKKLAERAINTIRMEESNEVIKLLLRDFEENASDWLWETNSTMELQHVSSRLAEVVHKPREHIIGTFPEVLLGDVVRFDHRAGSPVVKLKRLIGERSAFRDLVVSVIIDGEERYWSLTGKPILDKLGHFAGYHGVGSDITAQKRSQEQIAFLARHDSLTKLPNRVLFNEVLHQAVLRSEEEGLALLCLDLDDFKLVNDRLGHATGDGVLVAVGERIRACIRDRDIAARLGGDEFAVLLMSSDIEEIARIAQRIIDRVNRPYHFDGELVSVGVSIGISRAPKDSKTTAALMKNADLALYRAKADGRERAREEGRGLWRLYDSEMDERVQDRRSLQSDLSQALHRGEFHLDYQPIVDLATGRIVAAEALLRWTHPERGLLSPAEFIPMAEDAGLIGPIGRWVLLQACRTAALWPDDVRIAVNMSPLQFRDTGLVEAVDAVLAETGLAPSRLEIEITETTMLETNSQNVDVLWKLVGRGLRIALDDFGTGYSSLSYLRRFPFNKIKIDRSFIRDLGFEKDDSSIIVAIITLADSMNMTVTAEGVETTRQAELLRSYGCGQAQGFLYHRPMAAAEIGKILADNHRRCAALPLNQDAAQ